MGKWAYKFGGLEHTISRLLFILLVSTYLAYCYYYQKPIWYSIGTEVPLVAWMLRVDIVTWLSYWTCHKLEKVAFKKGL